MDLERKMALIKAPPMEEIVSEDNYKDFKIVAILSPSFVNL